MPAIYGSSYQIVQGPGSVAIIYEMIHETRVIPLDGRSHVVRVAPTTDGLEVELRRYLVDAEARFLYEPRDVAWRTHVFLATTNGEELDPRDLDEIEAARWGTLDELAHFSMAFLDGNTRFVTGQFVPFAGGWA